MVRRKEEFSLRFTDSLLLADGTLTVASSLANDIFNDPEAWSDASIDSAEEKFPQSAIASSRQAEFVVKPFAARRRRRASLSSMSSPESASITLQRMSVMFSPPSDCSPMTPEDPYQGARTPLSVATSSPNTAGIGSPIAVSASATWSFLEWLGGPDTPKTSKTAEWKMTIPPVPKLPPNIGSVQSGPRKSTLLIVPKVPPTPTKFVTAKRRPLPTVPTPSTASPRTANTSSPLAITSPPPPPPRGARLRSSSPSLTISIGAAPPTAGQRSTREPQYTPSVQKWVRSLPAPQTAASAVPRDKVPIAWLAN